MSLRLWLPLQGSTANQGLSNIALTSSPYSWGNNVGKLGRYCAIFNGSTSNIIRTTTTSLNYTDNFSWCMWVKPNYTGTSVQYVFVVGRADNGGYGYGVNVANATTLTVRFGSQSWNVGGLTNTAWCHVAFVKKGTNIKIYLNGALHTNATFSGTLPTYSDGGGLGLGGFVYNGGVLYPCYSSVQDFRIYNHNLSAKEVSDLSKGLVVHYKFNDIGGKSGNPNMLKNSYYGEGITLSYGATTAHTSSLVDNNDGTYTRKFVVTADPTSWHFTRISQNLFNPLLLKASTKYQFTMWLRTNKSVTFTVRILKGDATGSLANTLTFKSNGDSQWHKYTGTFTTIDTIPTTNQGQVLYIYGLESIGTYEYKWLKFEEGSRETDWIPNTADPLYAQRGYNNTVYDCSGYNVNATSVNNTLGTLSRMHSNAVYFGGTNSCVKASAGTLTGIINSNTYSMSVWVYPQALSSSTTAVLFSCRTPSGSTQGCQCYLGIRSNGVVISYYSDDHTISTTFSVNTWYHIVISLNNNVASVYVNGVLVGSVTKSGTSLSETAVPSIGGDSDRSSGWYKGYMSDFRFYSTALSANDAKGLYGMKQGVDNIGNMYEYDLNESNDISVTTFNRNGLINSWCFNELPVLFDYSSYQEPDGSRWVKIFHHNSPQTTGMFSNTDAFTTTFYKDANRWWNMPLCTHISQDNKWEIMIKQKPTSGGTEQIFRWTQNTSPMGGTFASVARANITLNTNSRYTTPSSSYGGIYKLNTNSYIVANNGNDGNFYGAIGCWNTTWNSQSVPGYNGVQVSTGYLDVYLRIDKNTQALAYTSNLFRSSVSKNGGINSNNFIEI